MLLHGLSVSLARLCSSRRILWDDTSWWPCLWHLSAGAHSMSCLHHCRTGTRSGCCLTSLPLAVHPYTSGETRSWIYAMECSWAAPPGSTLTSIIMVPALPGILMVTSVMISDLASGSVSVYSPSMGLLSALVLWAILLWTAKQENLLYIPSSSGPERTVFDDTLPCFSLLPPDVVVTSDGTEFFIVTAYAFCLGGFFGVFFFWCWWLPPPLPWPLLAPRGTTSVRLWLLASVRALSRLGCNLWMTDSLEMIDAFAPIARFPIRRTIAPLMRLATFATTLAIITAATGPSFRQCVSR